MIFLVMLTNFDHGAIPAANIHIKKDLNLNEFQIGTLMSLVFFGLCIGSITTTIIISRISYKNLLIGSFLINGLAFSVDTRFN